jgi:hypothetical protein
VAVAADKTEARFEPGKASQYKSAQTLDKITIAAVPYLTDEQTKPALGKNNPNKYGVLPVLVVFENNTGKALRLNLRAEYIAPDRRHVESISADDVQHLNGATKAPRMPGNNPLPIPLPVRAKKGPLNTWEIEGRAFVAKLLPPGESAYGFFYFYTEYEPGSKIYLTGVQDAATGQDYFYYEVPLDKQ